MKDLELYEVVVPVEKNFPIKFAKLSGRCHLHWHEHMELLYFLSPGEVFCADRTMQVTAGTLVIVHSEELHATLRGSFYCLRVSPDFFADVRFENARFLTQVLSDTFAPLFFRLFSLYEEKPIGYDLEIKSTVYHLFYILLSHHRAERLSFKEEQAEKNKLSRVGEIIAYIAKSYQGRLTTATLSAHFHLSEHYFCALFKEQTGETPLSYINRFRIEKARTLLKSTSKSITEIALAVGFDNPCYFTRLFKRYTGLTPVEYRRA